VGRSHHHHREGLILFVERVPAVRWWEGRVGVNDVDPCPAWAIDPPSAVSLVAINVRTWTISGCACLEWLCKWEEGGLKSQRNHVS